jgi:hypothetical protein
VDAVFKSEGFDTFGIRTSRSGEFLRASLEEFFKPCRHRSKEHMTGVPPIFHLRDPSRAKPSHKKDIFPS